MEERDEFWELHKQAEKNKAEQKDRFREGSKKKLLNSIKTKMRTNMIGALATFEERFGSLWGHSKKNLTPEEKKYAALWQEVRSKILDTGNRNIRNIEEEISQYNCEWNRYETKFIIVGEKENE